MGVKELVYKVETTLFRAYTNKVPPPRLENINSRTKKESATNYYNPIFVGTPSIRKGKYFITKELDSKYLKRLLNNGHLFSLHDLELASLDQHSFFSSLNFSKVVKYAWWTFSKDFLKELELAVQYVSPELLPGFIDTLSKNRSPYIFKNTDQEAILEPDAVKFARVKKLHCFKQEIEYNEINIKDKDNRGKVLAFLRKRQRIFKGNENKSFKKMKSTGIYREFSELFINDHWKEKFEFVLSFLRDKYETGAERWLIDELRDPSQDAPANGHFQLFFITYRFLQAGAFRKTKLTYSDICQQLYQSLRIDLGRSKFSEYASKIELRNEFSSKQEVKKEYLESFLCKHNIM